MKRRGFLKFLAAVPAAIIVKPPKKKIRVILAIDDAVERAYDNCSLLFFRVSICEDDAVQFEKEYQRSEKRVKEIAQDISCALTGEPK